ncbi:MAG: preprotein translocase subunit SecE [Clostridia bacterium]|jgi:preprotein translocase subunit SecE|nr:preprotein translocase subunit SecE [Clostridia bacterium]MBR6299943.1 preprotein translocase subunit SecE [Clostridia bacterium]
MADEKTTVKETGAAKTENKFLAFIKALPNKIATPFKNMWHELKKVTWPTKKDLINYTCIVLLFMVFMGVVIGLLDMGASRLVTAISSLKNTDTAEEAVAEVAETVPEVAENAVVEEATQTAEQAQTEAGSN